MKISTRGRYALRMMLDLAENQGSGVVALKDIAARQDISKKYLEQIIPVLNRAGLLQTSRGFQGGYRLAKAPQDYTVGEILRAAEGGLSPVACLEQSPNACPPLPQVRNAAHLGGFGAGGERIPGRHQPAGRAGWAEKVNHPHKI